MDTILESSGLVRSRSNSPAPSRSQEELNGMLKRLSTKVADMGLSSRRDQGAKTPTTVSDETNDELQLVSVVHTC